MPTHPPTTSESEHPPTKTHLPCLAANLKERLEAASAAVRAAAGFAADLDWLDDPETQAEGSPQRELARLRDELDTALGSLLFEVMEHSRWRAEAGRSDDLLCQVVRLQIGNGWGALRLMNRGEELFGEEKLPNNAAEADTLHVAFACETYQRVLILSDLAEGYPDHLRCSARHMEGWPMIVSDRADCAPEFQRLAKLLKIGAALPQS